MHLQRTASPRALYFHYDVGAARHRINEGVVTVLPTRISKKTYRLEKYVESVKFARKERRSICFRSEMEVSFTIQFI